MSQRSILRDMTMHQLITAMVVTGVALACASLHAEPRPVMKTKSPEKPGNERFKEQLEAVKQTNPQAYQWLKKQMDRQQAIDRILESLRERKIDVQTAERQLAPLVKAKAEDELADIDRRIASLKQQLEQFEELKANPEKWARKQIEQMVGKRNVQQVPGKRPTAP